MKKLLLFMILATLFSCSKKDKIGEQIKSSVVENAMGNDLKYNPVETKKVMSLSYGEYIDYLNSMFETNSDSKELNERIDYIIKNAKEENDGNTYNVFQFLKSGLQKFDSIGSRDSIYFNLYKHTYTIINPMFNNAKVSVTNYYFFDSQNNLLGHKGEDEYEEAKNSYIKNDNEAEINLFYEATNN